MRYRPPQELGIAHIAGSLTLAQGRQSQTERRSKLKLCPRLRRSPSCSSMEDAHCATLCYLGRDYTR